VSLLTSARCCPCPYVAAGCRSSRGSYVGGRLHLWVVGFVFLVVMVAVGSLVVVGIRGRSRRSVVVKSVVGGGDR